MTASPFVKLQADHTLLPFRRGGSPREEFYLRPSEIYCPVRPQDMGTFGSPISGSGCVNFWDERELLSRASHPLDSSLRFPCLLTHACGLPCGVRPLLPDTVHKHFKQNSGKSEFVLREGSVAGKEPSRGEKKGETRGLIYTYITRDDVRALS